MTNRIEKSIELKAPVAKVWQALTDAKEFGTWFRAKIDGPFMVGQKSRGNITVPGYEHLKWDATIKAMQPQSYFAFTWHPYPADPQMDYSKEEPTLVEFWLSPTATGTLLKVTESGFDKIPADRRAEAFRMNEGGWAGQMRNIAAYVAQ